MFTEIELDDVFVEAGHGFGPPGFEMEPPPVTRLVAGCRYDIRRPVADMPDRPELETAILAGCAALVRAS